MAVWRKAYFRRALRSARGFCFWRLSQAHRRRSSGRGRPTPQSPRQSAHTGLPRHRRRCGLENRRFRNERSSLEKKKKKKKGSSNHPRPDRAATLSHTKRRVSLGYGVARTTAGTVQVWGAVGCDIGRTHAKNDGTASANAGFGLRPAHGQAGHGHGRTRAGQGTGMVAPSGLSGSILSPVHWKTSTWASCRCRPDSAARNIRTALSRVVGLLACTQPRSATASECNDCNATASECNGCNEVQVGPSQHPARLSCASRRFRRRVDCTYVRMFT